MTKTMQAQRNPLTLRGQGMSQGASAPAPVFAGASLEHTILPYTQIRTDGGTQMRTGLNETTAGDYADELRQGARFPPVVVFYDGEAYWLGDGFHRVRAYFLAYGHMAEIPCEVRPGTRRDAVLCAAAANALHGLPRTNADKRRAVEVLVRDEEWGQWSDRELARRCHVHHDLVASVRKLILAESASMSATEEEIARVNAPALRTYVHPKTGKASRMQVGGIVGANRQRANGETDAEASERILAESASMGAQQPLPARGVGDELPAELVALGCELDIGGGWYIVRYQEQTDTCGSLAQAIAWCWRVVGGACHLVESTEAGTAGAPSEGARQQMRPAHSKTPVLAVPSAADEVQSAARGRRMAELLTLYRQVVSTLSEYGALTGRHTHTPAVRRALEPLIEELKQNREQGGNLA